MLLVEQLGQIATERHLRREMQTHFYSQFAHTPTAAYAWRRDTAPALICTWVWVTRGAQT